MGARTPEVRNGLRYRQVRHALTPPFALLLALTLVTAVSLTCCTRGSHLAGIPAAAPNPDEPASIKIEPAPGAHDVDPVAPVSVSAQTGTLTDVAMVNDAGKPVDGVLTPGCKGLASRRAAGLRAHLHAHHHQPRSGRKAVQRNQFPFSTLHAAQPDQGVLPHHVGGRAAGRRHLWRRAL